MLDEETTGAHFGDGEALQGLSGERGGKHRPPRCIWDWRVRDWLEGPCRVCSAEPPWCCREGDVCAACRAVLGKIQ